jgi:hypothetical protein
MRWEHEDVVEWHKVRIQDNKSLMRQRRASFVHPFGTLKRRAGWNHFLMRGLEKSKGEFSLMVLSYNFTRVLNILGLDRLREYYAQRSENKDNRLGYT